MAEDQHVQVPQGVPQQVPRPIWIHPSHCLHTKTPALYPALYTADITSFPATMAELDEPWVWTQGRQFKQDCACKEEQLKLDL